MKTPFSNITFVRHGQALHNTSKKFWDINVDDALGLTAEGVEQACRVIDHFPEDDLSLVKLVSSDQIRAIQTSSIFAGSLSARTGRRKEVERDSRLREFYFVNSGFPLSNFDFEAYVSDPFRVFGSSNPHVAESECKSMFELCDDIWDFMCYTAKSPYHHICFSHHFTISAAECMTAIGGQLRSLRDLSVFAKAVAELDVEHCKPLRVGTLLDDETRKRLLSLL